MKKLFPILMLVAALFSLCGCASEPPENTIATQHSITDPIVQNTEDQVPTTEPVSVPGTVPVAVPITEPFTVPQTEPEPTSITEPVTEPASEPVSISDVLLYEDMKALWLSQFDLTHIYLNGNTQRDEADFTARVAQVMDNVKAQGFNTVFLQVRPYADSMYPSEFYPMSSYVTGRYGYHAQYDPVEIIVQLAHNRGLSIHAWINPLRGMTEEELQLIDTEYTIRRWYDDPQLCGRYIVLVNGRWYLNPAYNEVVDLICSGAEEALFMYDFDGLHMDDYFYPTTDTFFDAEAYADDQASGGSLDLADFRRNNINKLVHKLCEITHNSRAGRIFGISPAGNVDTAFNTHYADVYQWCGTFGYVDYICPQVYFGLEHGSHDFVKVCNTYQDMIQADSVDLIIGMTFGKAFSKEDPWAGTGKDEWRNNRNVLARCLQTTSGLEKCQGVAVFSYQYFFDPLTGLGIAQTEEERDNFVPVLQDITWN